MYAGLSKLLLFATSVTMNTQLHSTLDVSPYEVVFGLKPSSEPVKELIVVEEAEDCDLVEDNEDGDDCSHQSTMSQQQEIIFKEGIYFLPMCITHTCRSKTHFKGI